MAVLGKRKAAASSVDEADAAEIFRRHFEAQFQPLSPAEEKTKDGRRRKNEIGEQDRDQGESNSEDDEWGGLSEDGSDLSGSDSAGSEDDDLDEEDEESDEEDVETVEVVDYSSPKAPQSTSMSKRELKSFMSSRPPDQTSSNEPSQQATSSKSSSTLPEDAPSLLAQDLELRRLISESHLLSPRGGPLSSTSSASSSAQQQYPTAKTFTEGRTRQKATDLRVLALGSKTSILKQEKMPMSMRKGISAAADARETKRRKQARENGIVLERETGGKKKARKRDRTGGVDRPGVGRMRGAELRVSERDVRRIEGSRDVFGRRSKR